MRIEFKGADRLAKKLREVATKYPRERDMFLRGIGQEVLSGAKMGSPVDTGYLRNSWTMTEPSGGSVEIGTNCEYAQYVEFPHRQFAWGHDTGKVTEGAFMLRNAVENVADDFNARANALLARLFN